MSIGSLKTVNQKQIALVTGASRGIGRAIAEGLAKACYIDYVIGTATSEAGAKTITDRFSELKLPGCGKVLNITDQLSIRLLMTEINQEHGVSPLILVNNAGINRDNLLIRMKADEWQSVINTNLCGTFYVTQACLKPMFKARFGRIINIGSIVGSIGNPGQTNYAATKAAINGFSQSLAKEVAQRNITVNVVAPGFIKTDMTDRLSDKHKEALLHTIPVKRIGLPAEIASVVVFLASSESSYITAQVIHVNGGMY